MANFFQSDYRKCFRNSLVCNGVVVIEKNVFEIQKLYFRTRIVIIFNEHHSLIQKYKEQPSANNNDENELEEKI